MAVWPAKPATSTSPPPYGDLGAGFAECHHKLPLAAGERRTLLSDLAIVCANCHRMLHRRSPWLTVEELQEILATSGSGS
jgi:5-methylcytosine-specific restriction protein A